jgi:phosphoadenosine phosphosulfate reductase
MVAALAFSGGKDSWACLWLYKDQLADIQVVWVNTGKNYPELLKTIELAKEMCPNFVELNIDRVAQNERHGIPSAIVPIDWTGIGQAITGEKSVTIQSYLGCCYENIALPLLNYCADNNITTLIRGQRLDESRKSTAVNGTVLNGVTFVQPIETWSTEDVLSYNAAHMDLPDHFRFKHSSMDCYDCTAFDADLKDIRGHCATEHPILFKEYKTRKDALSRAIEESLNG